MTNTPDAGSPKRSAAPRYGKVDRDYAIRLATAPADEDAPVYMVNLMKYREKADYTDGTELNISGREADDLYAPVGPLAAIGASMVFLAEVDTQLLGDAPLWDRIAVVRYPSGRAFIEMQSRTDFKEKHVHKEAGMAETIVMGCTPIDVPKPTNQPSWADVPHPATEDDGPVVVMHVIKYAEGGLTDHMQAYQNAAGDVAVPHGVRINGWYQVQGTIMGDGRQWDQVRFNAFPSKAAFMAVAADPTRLAAQKEHREPAIADTYALILRPSINRLEKSAAW
ncbi:MAG: hypothetical protein WCK14_03510 [Actinomycetota bacterium]